MRFNRFLSDNLKAAIELFLNSNLKADIFLNLFFKKRRIGKRDRTWISDRFYYYFRHRNFFDELSLTDGVLVKNIAEVFEDEIDEILTIKINKIKKSDNYNDLFNCSFSTFLKSSIIKYYKNEVFDWFNSKSKVTLRTNLNKIERNDLILKLRLENYEVDCSPISPAGIIVYGNSSGLKKKNLFLEGFFEFQDESSQIATLLVSKESDNIFDCCAGGGGKSLAVKTFFPRISVTASDNREYLFQEIESRAKRADTKIITNSYKNLERETFKTVFIDAPCSGSGVIRRNPCDRYSITKESIANNVRLQKSLLEKFSCNVEKGGELIYVTCSFLKEENEEIVEDFISKNKNFYLKSVSERLCENLENKNEISSVICGNYFKTVPLFERDLMFGAIMRKK